MPDIKALVATVAGDDEKASWAAVAQLVALRPTNEEESKARAYACCCMAEASFARNKIGTAIDWWQEAINCEPLNSLYRLAFVARGLLPAGMHLQARNEVDRAIRLNEKDPDGWRLRGHVLLAMRDADGAIEAFDKQISLDPDNPISYLDRSDTALERGDWETVERCVNKVLEIGGEQRGNALHQLGLMAMRQGRLEDAMVLWDQALERKCDNSEVVSWNYSVALLALGHYRDGWRMHEARAIQKRDSMMSIQTHRGMLDRFWNNEPPPARLHVSQEMGFGDVMAMARYLPILVEKGYDVRYEVNDGLVDLLRDSLPGVTVMPQAPIYPGLLGVPEFDYLVPALSLPRLFGTTVETIPWNGPYLKADPKRVAAYREQLHGRKAIGLCWSAGIRTQNELWLAEYGKRKSIAFDELRPIINSLTQADAAIVSLQVGPERGRPELLDLLPSKPTWADTAALVECLDLIITVDTGLAHLVGGMGKPLWLMMHTEGSWHWMVERAGAPWNEKSPWYPSARLFRAKKPHEWGDVVSQIASQFRLQAAA